MTDAAHDLLPDKFLTRLPPRYGTEQQDDPIAHLKWFTPDSSWTWYVLEYDPADRLCFGLVIGQERELGYFSLDELLTLRGPLGLKVERDLYWEPRPLSQCR